MRVGDRGISLAQGVLVRWWEDVSVPLAIAQDPADMQTLELLAWHNIQEVRPHFLPVHLGGLSKNNRRDESNLLNIFRRKIFLVFAGGATRDQAEDQRDVERELRRCGAQIYDLAAAALYGLPTLARTMADHGADAALQLFLKAERCLTRNVPVPFDLTSSGVYLKAQSQGPERSEDHVWVCSPLLVQADSRNHQNEDWGKRLVFLDKDGSRHCCCLSMAALAANRGECCAYLLSQGLQIAPGRKAREMVIAYILAADPEERVRSTNAVGWHNDTYVLMDKSIGPVRSEQVVHQTSAKSKSPVPVQGSLEDWKDAIGRLCAGNSRLVFAVSCAFAPPFLRLVEEPGGGFNFFGASSTGKTTALKVAASVWGSQGTLKTWRMTANALDAVAQNHHDGLICLDELGQADGKEVGEIVYALANGSPKQRKISSPAEGWTLLVLSSGETNLAEHMYLAGKPLRPGHQVRLCDIAVDAGAGLGIFEDLHGFANPSLFARHLAESARRFYGSPIRAFLQALVENKEKALHRVVVLRHRFLEQYVPFNASGELRRAASRFAFVAAAGEWATEMGVTGWQEGESMFAAGLCFESWLRSRAGTTVVTAEIILGQVRRFLKSAEFRTDREGAGLPYLVLPEVFRREVCAGLDPRLVARTLKAEGYLQHDRGRYDKSVRLPGGKRRVYSIRAEIFDRPGATRRGPNDIGGDTLERFPRMEGSASAAQAGGVPSNT